MFFLIGFSPLKVTYYQSQVVTAQTFVGKKPIFEVMWSQRPHITSKIGGLFCSG
jgi:hypothetical protein